jgi:sodium-dependent dicarboxylate transporter 2/3/5
LTLGFGLFFILLLAPGIPLDPLQRKVAAVTALTAILWITVALPVGITSLFPAALFPILGIMHAREVAPIYMRDLVMLFLGAFIIALGLERWALHRRMALWIIDRVGTRPRSLVLGFMTASAFLSLWINNTATTLLMLPIALAVIASMQQEEGGTVGEESKKEQRSFSLCLLLGIAYAASIGGTGTPVGTAPNQEFLGQFADRYPGGPQLSFGDWFIAWIPLVVIFVPVAWFLLTRFLAPVADKEGRGAEVIRAEREQQGPITTPQKRMALVFGATAILWITRADLDLGLVRIPGWSRLLMDPAVLTMDGYAAHKNDISDSTVALLMALACFLIPSGARKGVALMDWSTARRLPWEVLLLLGGGFCIARGFQVSGLDAVLGNMISPLFGTASPWLVVLIVVFSMSFLTELTSNTATTAVLLPVMAQGAAQGGIHPLLVMAPATIAASAAFMLPVATPPNAVVFSSRLVRVPEMARVGLWLNLTTVILITLVFQFWVRRVWNIGEALPDWAGGAG